MRRRTETRGGPVTASAGFRRLVPLLLVLLLVLVVLAGLGYVSTVDGWTWD